MQNVKSISSFADFFSVLLWRKACLFFEQLDKVIHVLDAALSCNFLDRLRGHTQQEDSFLDAFLLINSVSVQPYSRWNRLDR